MSWDYTGNRAGEDYSSSYNSSDAEFCYQFEFKGSGEQNRVSVITEGLNPGSGYDNCDWEGVATFKESSSSPWYINLSDSIYNWDRYWDDVNQSQFDYMFVAARAHSEGYDTGDTSFSNYMKSDYSIYCAPSSVACDAVGEFLTNCDVSCYNKETQAFTRHIYLRDNNEYSGWEHYNENLWVNPMGGCPSSNVGDNEFYYPEFRVYTKLTENTTENTYCERTVR